eukprot:CAMPEP_0175203924 /NCGR_PEP_ID=MMETSP0093-20121207/11312_1 /TAXON_ID=311494 /ORGANISM="Alexandrium monilatum, Strain CCMP3105" /LENGTH=181 /DNA_ID=CAMNT_0016497001 /DNA_START=8 /DNA_END=550 /DNA_ORIENTATION=+
MTATAATSATFGCRRALIVSLPVARRLTIAAGLYPRTQTRTLRVSDSDLRLGSGLGLELRIACTGSSSDSGSASALAWSVAAGVTDPSAAHREQPRSVGLWPVEGWSEGQDEEHGAGHEQELHGKPTVVLDEPVLLTSHEVLLRPSIPKPEGHPVDVQFPHGSVRAGASAGQGMLETPSFE